MKILFCAKAELSKELGASKALIELAEEMVNIGWECDLLSPADLLPPGNGRSEYAERLRQFLRVSAGEYDVVDYDHNELPYSRNEFSQRTLFVARAVLLAHHFDNIRIPNDKGLKSRVRSMTVGLIEGRRRSLRIERADKTVREADLVNVANYDDKTELMKVGIPDNKIAVLPCGLSNYQRRGFESISNGVPSKPKVAFIGTFDNRKGATDFPAIVRSILQDSPETTFRFLGTYKQNDAVLAVFPKALRRKIEIVPRYCPEELPELLVGCSVGIFPSYVEGFGIGVLEMLAASIPVVAYNTPGPPMMLSSDFLVKRGDVQELSRKVTSLLNDRQTLAAARIEARRQSQPFCWEPIARSTSQIYLKHLEQKRASLS